MRQQQGNGCTSRVLAALALVGLLAGCAANTGKQQAPASGQAAGSPATSQPAGQAAAQRVELRALWWGSQDRHEKTMKAFEAYTKKNPHVTIASEFSGWDVYWDKVSVKVASGDAPDIIQMDFRYLADYAQRGALYDLTPFVGKELDVAEMDKNLLEAGKVGGRLYAVCLGGNTFTMMVNKTLLDKAGLPVPSMEWTWNDLEQYGKQFKAKMGPDYWYTPDISGDINRFEYWVRMQGFPGVWKDGKLAVTEKEVSGWLQLWERLRKEGIAPPADVTAATGGALENSLWVKQRAPLQWGWSNEYERYSTVIKDEVVMTAYPRGGKADGHYPKCSQYFSVYSKSKHPAEAAKLISWFINDPESLRINGSNRGVPVSQKAINTLKQAGLSKVDAAVFDIVAQISAFAGPTPEPAPKGSTDVGKLWERLAEEHRFGRKTADQAAKEFVAETNRILAKAGQ